MSCQVKNDEKGGCKVNVVVIRVLQRGTRGNQEREGHIWIPTPSWMRIDIGLAR